MAGSTGPSLTVFLIEDDEQILYLLRFILEQDGYAVREAKDIPEALAAASGMAPPQLVITDVMMPSGESYDLLPRLRALPGWRNVPVLMLTAKAMKRDIEQGLAAGADDYLAKPFKVDELRARVRRLAGAPPASG